MTTATDRIAAAAHTMRSASSRVSGRTGVTPMRRRMPRSRYWPMTTGTPVRPRTASTIATLMDAMYSVPIWPDRPFCGSPNPGISPNPMTSATGSPNTPMAAPVSRKNSLVSTKASLLKPFMSPSPSAFHALAGQRHVGAVQAASLDPQVGYQHLPAGEFGGDSAGKVAGAGDGDLRIVAAHHRDAGQRGQRLLVKRRHRPEPHPVLTPGVVHEPRRGVQRRDPPPFENRDAIAQFLHLVHEVADQYDGDALVADLSDQIPGGVPRARVQARGQLVEEHHLRVPDQGQRDEQALLLAAGELGEPGVRLSGQAPALEQLVPVGRVRVERGVQLERLAYLQLLLELGLLQLHADPLVQPAAVGQRVQAQDPHLAAVPPAQPLHAFHRGGLARAVRAQDAEDLPFVDVERDVVHDRLTPSTPVTLGEPGHLDDCRHHAP